MGAGALGAVLGVDVTGCVVFEAAEPAAVTAGAPALDAPALAPCAPLAAPAPFAPVTEAAAGACRAEAPPPLVDVAAADLSAVLSTVAAPAAEVEAANGLVVVAAEAEADAWGARARIPPPPPAPSDKNDQEGHSGNRRDRLATPSRHRDGVHEDGVFEAAVAGLGRLLLQLPQLHIGASHLLGRRRARHEALDVGAPSGPLVERQPARKILQRRRSGRRQVLPHELFELGRGRGAIDEHAQHGCRQAHGVRRLGAPWHGDDVAIRDERHVLEIRQRRSARRRGLNQLLDDGDGFLPDRLDVSRANFG